MEAHLSHPRCQHCAVEGTPQGQLLEKRWSHLLEISHMYYTIESGAAAMCAGKAIHALCQGCQSQKNKPKRSTSQCSNCNCSHPPGHDNCPVQNAICKSCSKKVPGMQSATALVLLANNPLSPMELKRPHHQCHGKGKKADMVQVNTEEAPPCNELFINVVDCGTVGDTHPDEIAVDDVHVL